MAAGLNGRDPTPDTDPASGADPTSGADPATGEGAFDDDTLAARGSETNDTGVDTSFGDVTGTGSDGDIGQHRTTEAEDPEAAHPGVENTAVDPDPVPGKLAEFEAGESAELVELEAGELAELEEELETALEAGESAEPSRKPTVLRRILSHTRQRPFLLAAGALLAGATVFAVWTGWSWYAARGDDAVTHAQARDAALADGRDNLGILSSLDHQRVEEGIQGWIEVSTGPLEQRVADSTEETKTALREAGTVANGDVLDAGITELDEYGGTATMVAAVEIRKSTEDSVATTERHRFTAGLTRTDEGWKLDSLNQLPLAID